MDILFLIENRSLEMPLVIDRRVRYYRLKSPFGYVTIYMAIVRLLLLISYKGETK